MSSGFIHFFQTSAGTSPRHVQAALLQHGLGVRLYRHVDALCDALAGGPAESREAQLVMLAGAHAHNCEAAVALRRVDTRVGVVALLPTVQDDCLLQAMHSGIDACWHDRAPSCLLVQGVMRLIDRAGACGNHGRSACRSGQAVWRVESRGWRLQAPGGAFVELTTAERALLLALCRAPAQALSHADMLAVIASGVYARSGAATARRLSVLMSRLRRKFAVAGLSMPIRSVRGVGYELAATIEIPPTED